MEKIIVKKSPHLSGEVSCSGSKNAALPILAATILTKGKTTLYNIPQLSDITNMLSVLSELGGICTRERDSLIIDFSDCRRYITPYESMSKFRGSFLLAAPLLSRMGKARISMPGGCPIGVRPIDLHLKGFACLGADIKKGHGYVDLSCKSLTGNNIYLDFPSVGATENLIMAAVLANGETVIQNAAAEPEICDLADFLTKQGARIEGAGSDTVKITGVSELSPCSYTIISDRIEAGTFMSAFAITGGKGTVKNINPDHLKPVTAKLSEMGAEITEYPDRIFIDATHPMNSSSIKTLPFPGFPTDMQAQFTSLFSSLKGTSIVTETIFENRFQHICELKRMGANIKIDGRCAVIEGAKLSGAKVMATDLRAGAALVLAGLTADGETEIDNAEVIKRGYTDFFENLNLLGANIKYYE